MFKKKTCKRCGKKTSDKNDFCPHCGASLRSRGQNKEEGWGMLGKDDFMPQMDNMKLPMGFNMLFNSLMKNLDKQFRNFENEMKEENSKNKNKNVKKGGVSISISSFDGMPPEIKVQSFGNAPGAGREGKINPNRKNKKGSEEEGIQSVNFSSDKKKKFSNLPHEEPSTNIRRFSDRVVYEINIPGVKSKDDISINILDNSIEIKAVSKDKAYFKLIPISLPLMNYNLSKGKLVLELGEKEG